MGKGLIICVLLIALSSFMINSVVAQVNESQNCTVREDCYPIGFTPSVCGDFYTCNGDGKCVAGSNTCEVQSSRPGCAYFYWFDDTNSGCGRREFCGTFVYKGLRTYETASQCEAVLKQNGRNKVVENETDTDNANCSSLYWFDSENKSCGGQREFCGLYMYQGLQTFESKTQCERALNNSEKKYFNLSNGRNAEIKIMPETASERAIARLGELGFNITFKEIGQNFTLKEVGKGNETQVVYELTGNKQGKFLGIFKIMASEKVQLDAETGEIKVIKPWWAFLASGI